jgi:tetratricopeptide (TPR) repeat protein
MTDDESEHPLKKGLEIALEYAAQWEEKLKDPVRRKAWELVQAGEDLFWRKQYDEGIQKLVDAAALDPDYLVKVEAYRQLKLERLRKGRVNLTTAVNKILFPRLVQLGFRLKSDVGASKWKEGSMLFRTNAAGNEGAVQIGRDKFGNRFSVSVARSSSAGKWTYLDLRQVGLPDEALRYLNQPEANAVLERVAAAFEGPILGWLDEP